MFGVAESSGEQDFGGLIAGAAAAGTGVVAIRVYAAGALSARTERHPRAWLPPRPLIPGSDYGDDVERARGLEGLVFELGLESPLELGLRFALAAPGVSTALVGLSSLEHLQAALGWAGRGPLDPQTVDRILDMAGA
jgi:aryl-alcohol dehydrogenase-like predicted oxidoreductase